MVALSRLKATFEACLGLFRRSMKAMGRESRSGGMQKPRWRVRRTEPLPTMYSLQYTRRQKQLRTAEDAWAKAASVSVPCACRKSGPEASEKASLFRKWRWLGHAKEYGHMWCLCVMPFTGFSTNSTLTLWILSKHSKPQPAWCALPLLLYSTQHPHPFTYLNSCGHSPFLTRTSSWMVWAGSCQPTLLVRKVFHSKLTEWQIWLPRKSSQVAPWLGRWSECDSSYPAFFCGCRVSFLLTGPAAPPFQVSSRLHSRCGDQRDASLHSLLRQ